MLLLASGTFIAASAQHYDQNDYSRRENYNQRHYDRGSNGFREKQMPINEINRAYDRRIMEVKNDFRLSGHQKRKAIREMNRERNERIKEVNRRIGNKYRY